MLRGKSFEKQDAKGEEYLLVDKDLIKGILEMQHDLSPGNDFISWPPLATVAKGSSPYADGYVNFIAKSRAAVNARLHTFKFMVMVQPKDYFNSYIRTTELMENIQRCRSQELTDLFGDRRLMCVASRLNKMLVVAQCDIFRDYIVYATDRSQILTQLMSKLDKRRNGDCENIHGRGFAPAKLKGIVKMRDRPSPGKYDSLFTILSRLTVDQQSIDNQSSSVD